MVETLLPLERGKPHQSFKIPFEIVIHDRRSYLASGKYVLVQYLPDGLMNP